MAQSKTKAKQRNALRCTVHGICGIESETKRAICEYCVCVFLQLWSQQFHQFLFVSFAMWLMDTYINQWKSLCVCVCGRERHRVCILYMNDWNLINECLKKIQWSKMPFFLEREKIHFWGYENQEKHMVGRGWCPEKKQRWHLNWTKVKKSNKPKN